MASYEFPFQAIGPAIKKPPLLVATFALTVAKGFEPLSSLAVTVKKAGLADPVLILAVTLVPLPTIDLPRFLPSLGAGISILVAVKMDSSATVALRATFTELVAAIRTGLLQARVSTRVRRMVIFEFTISQPRIAHGEEFAGK